MENSLYSSKAASSTVSLSSRPWRRAVRHAPPPIPGSRARAARRYIPDHAFLAGKMAVLHRIQTRITKSPNPLTLLNRNFHLNPKSGFESASPAPRTEPKNVAIFWDLDNKPPNQFGPYEAALKLRKTASSFGFVRDMIAYANRHSLSSVPKAIREQKRERRALDQLENRGVVKPLEPYHCGVCGRNFYHHEKLLNHFKQIHERENVKRLNQIESARGSKRVKLVAKYSMKMEKFKRAARDVLTPKAGCYSLRDELERAGFRVGSVEDRPQAADIAMRNHMVEVMDKRRAECLVLVSDDYGFADILKEAKMRCIKTVVVGNHVVDGGSGGALKRVANSGFCWTEIMRGKAKKEAVSVIGKWKDRDVLERLEWRYDPEAEKKSVCGLDDKESIESCVDEEEDDDGCEQLDRSSSWWELELESDDVGS